MATFDQIRSRTRRLVAEATAGFLSFTPTEPFNTTIRWCLFF